MPEQRVLGVVENTRKAALHAMKTRWVKKHGAAPIVDTGVYTHGSTVEGAKRRIASGNVIATGTVKLDRMERIRNRGSDGFGKIKKLKSK